jgi:methionyl-tRNA formyltransferase
VKDRGTAVVFAYHDVGCLGVKTLVRLGVKVALVYTHEDDPKENRFFGSVGATCDALGIPCRTADPHGEAELAAIRAAAPDAIFSLYYRDLLRSSVLSLAKRAAVNLHGSYLPRYRGRAPVNWMILHGETTGGVTLHHMVARADAGDIVDQESFAIGPEETAVEVYAKMLPAAERVLERSALAVLDGTAPRFVQMETKATTFPRRRPEDGLIEWRWRAEDVRNLVRAVTHPYPGAFTFAGATRVLVWRVATAPQDVRHGPVPGTVSRDDGVTVHCGDGRSLRLVRVEIAGREGDPAEFADTLRDGTVLGNAK